MEPAKLFPARFPPSLNLAQKPGICNDSPPDHASRHFRKPFFYRRRIRSRANIPIVAQRTDVCLRRLPEYLQIRFILIKILLNPWMDNQLL